MRVQPCVPAEVGQLVSPALRWLCGVGAAGTGGAFTVLDPVFSGSGTAPALMYLPFVPPRKVKEGVPTGPPLFPKSAPVPVVHLPLSLGPALERSTVPLTPLLTVAVEL